MAVLVLFIEQQNLETLSSRGVPPPSPLPPAPLPTAKPGGEASQTPGTAPGPGHPWEVVGGGLSGPGPIEDARQPAVGCSRSQAIEGHSQDSLQVSGSPTLGSPCCPVHLGQGWRGQRRCCSVCLGALGRKQGRLGH